MQSRSEYVRVHSSNGIEERWYISRQRVGDGVHQARQGPKDLQSCYKHAAGSLQERIRDLGACSPLDTPVTVATHSFAHGLKAATQGQDHRLQPTNICSTTPG